MIEIGSISIGSLPSSESDDLEYKSSRIADNQLKREIQNSASAFWNSGGGVFLAGIRDDGVADGGIDRNRGRQTIEDWLAQVISEVHSQGRYSFRVLEHSDCAAIEGDKCVLAVQFAPSAAIPHQSADKRYYIRAGAHTVPAPHFIVDALYARRHFRNPRHVHVARVNPFTTKSAFLHIEVLAATDGVALDVEIDFDPRPTDRHLSFPIAVPIIDREHSFGFRFEVELVPAFESTIKVKYRDFADAWYSYDAKVEASKCVLPWNRDPGGLEEVADEIRELKRVMERRNDTASFS